MPLGPLRVLGSRVVDGSAEANAARVGAACRAAVWNEAAGGDRTASTENPGLSRARTEYDRCVTAAAEPSVFSMRGCLESRHDQLMRDLTVDYWNADVGS